MYSSVRKRVSVDVVIMGEASICVLIDVFCQKEKMPVDVVIMDDVLVCALIDVFFCQERNVSVDVVIMGEGSEVTVIDAIHAAEREDTWLIIDQLHLTSDSSFKQLGYHLHRIAKSRGKFH